MMEVFKSELGPPPPRHRRDYAAILKGVLFPAANGSETQLVRQTNKR